MLPLAGEHELRHFEAARALEAVLASTRSSARTSSAGAASEALRTAFGTEDLHAGSGGGRRCPLSRAARGERGASLSAVQGKRARRNSVGDAQKTVDTAFRPPVLNRNFSGEAKARGLVCVSMGGFYPTPAIHVSVRVEGRTE